MTDDSHSALPPARGPLPRPPLPGPSGEKARIARSGDSSAVALLLRQFLQESGSALEEDRIGWVAQTIARDPLRGLFVVGGSAGDPHEVGLAAVSTSLDPVRGWVGWFTCLYIRPEYRRRGVAIWLMGETLELARHHGINHIRFETGPEDGIVRRILAKLPVVERQARIEEINLHPHFDDGGS
jgi:GNAT superfamily N-acetyltransferase